MSRHRSVMFRVLDEAFVIEMSGGRWSIEEYDSDRDLFRAWRTLPNPAVRELAGDFLADKLSDPKTSVTKQKS